MAAPAQPVQAQQPAMVTVESLATIGDADAQKQYLGELLYPRVMAVDQGQAGRIVGMILHEFPMDAIIENVRNDAVLQSTIQAAVTSLAAAEAQPKE